MYSATTLPKCPECGQRETATWGMPRDCNNELCPRSRRYRYAEQNIRHELWKAAYDAHRLRRALGGAEG